MRRCKLKGCGKKHYGNGYCRKHYNQHKYFRNRDENIRTAREWRRKNRERYNAMRRAYYQKNRKKKFDEFLKQYWKGREPKAFYLGNYISSDGVAPNNSKLMRRWRHHSANRGTILCLYEQKSIIESESFITYKIQAINFITQEEKWYEFKGMGRALNCFEKFKKLRWNQLR